KDSASSLCFDALFAGLGLDVSYLQNDILKDTVNGEKWIERWDSLYASIWLNNSFHFKRIQINLKFPLHLNVDALKIDLNETDSSKLHTTPTFSPKLQFGWYPKFHHSKLDGNIRIQLSYLREFNKSLEDQNQFEINCGGKIPHFGIHQISLKWLQS